MSESSMTTILVIDPDDNLRKDIVDLLEIVGYAALQAATGSDGMAKSLAEHPDLIVCADTRSLQGGHQMLEELRSHPATVTIPIVFMTMRSNVERGFDLAGINEYLNIPFDVNELLAMIKTGLARKRGNLEQ